MTIINGNVPYSGGTVSVTMAMQRVPACRVAPDMNARHDKKRREEVGKGAGNETVCFYYFAIS